MPTRKATIVDLTCDSDGTIHQFVQAKKISKWINLHEFNNTPYYIGVFLVGAYQEILGGLHNLFGDTNAVHVDFDEQGNCEIKNLIEGDSIREVLGYVQYNTDDLMERLRCAIEKALKNNHLTFEESAKLKYHFKQALESYTYLVV
jgi:arginine decarboxylase